MNLYQAFGGNPVNFVDPWGMTSKTSYPKPPKRYSGKYNKVYKEIMKEIFAKLKKRHPKKAGVKFKEYGRTEVDISRAILEWNHKQDQDVAIMELFHENLAYAVFLETGIGGASPSVNWKPHNIFIVLEAALAYYLHAKFGKGMHTPADTAKEAKGLWKERSKYIIGNKKFEKEGKKVIDLIAKLQKKHQTKGGDKGMAYIAGENFRYYGPRPLWLEYDKLSGFKQKIGIYRFYRIFTKQQYMITKLIPSVILYSFGKKLFMQVCIQIKKYIPGKKVIVSQKYCITLELPKRNIIPRKKK